MMIARSAFTLLEVLVATLLLTAVSLTAFAWIRDVGRLDAGLRQGSDDAVALDAVIRLVTDDLVQTFGPESQAVAVSADGILSLQTLHHAGEQGQGALKVRYIPDTTNRGLLREAIPLVPASAPNGAIITDLAPRLITGRFSSCRFLKEKDDLWLEVETRDEPRTLRRLILAASEGAR